MASRIADLAREEALPDTPDETPGLEPDETPQEPDEDAEEEEAAEGPPEQAEPAEGLTEAQAEAIFASIERENTRHAREVEKRAGPMFGDLVPCPACTAGGGPTGFIFPMLPEPEQTMRRQGVLMALGGEPEAAYVEDDETQTCDKCQGLGKTLTGSHAPGQETRVCPRCNGQGWKAKVYAAPPVAPASLWQPVPTDNGVAAPQIGPLDAWQRPQGHPHYGVPPSQIGA